MQLILTKGASTFLYCVLTRIEFQSGVESSIILKHFCGSRALMLLDLMVAQDISAQVVYQWMNFGKMVIDIPLWTRK